MPVIFVHGVNNRRENPGYEPSRQIAEKFLRKYLVGASVNGKHIPDGVLPVFPYWGDLATKFAWDMRSLPRGEIDSLGTAGVEVDLRPLVALVKDALEDASAAADEPLVALARQDFQLAIDVLCDVLIANPFAQNPGEVAEFVVQAQLYGLKFAPPAAPPWVAAVTTDLQFVAKLAQEVSGSAPSGIDALGVFNKIGNALAAAAIKFKHAISAAKTKVLDSTGDFASTKALAWSRASLNATLGRFFGDVFIYMHSRGQRGAPGPIPSRILDAWDTAIAAAPEEPLIIIGHSLGGVISFDLLSHFRPDITADLFVTVGSQVSHFEEMKLFLASDPSIPNGDFTRRVEMPANIRRWINVFDEVDIFSYACGKVFEGVQDLHYDTRTYVIKAHGAYFAQPRFYERLRARINQI